MKKYKTKEEWRLLLREQEESGLSAAAFYRKKNIHPNTFYYKRKEHRTGQFVKLSVPAVGISGASGIKIRIENITIEPGTDIRENQLKFVIRSVPEVVNADIQ